MWIFRKCDVSIYFVPHRRCNGEGGYLEGRFSIVLLCMCVHVGVCGCMHACVSVSVCVHVRVVVHGCDFEWV